MPPPATTRLASRLLLRPALRTQPDRRLVSLVREGYESAFDEIVRRYGKSLGRYAAAIVPSHRAEDVTQDAFSKALLALRNGNKDIELRPWLYRIVRNTALNDLRDQPPRARDLDERFDGVDQPPEIAERREEVADLVRRLQELPEPQRAAIVMRELEGLSHEEIAVALGMTGGGARQAIYRARRALRDGVGLLIPVPVLHALLGSSAGGAGLAGAAAGGASVGAAGAGASLGGAGAGAVAKTGLATILVAGSVAAGVALEDRVGGSGSGKAAAAKAGGGDSAAPATSASLGIEGADGGAGSPGDGGADRGPGGGDRHEGELEQGAEDRSGEGSGSSGPGDASGSGSNSGPGGGDLSAIGSSNSGPGSDSSGSGSSGSDTSGSLSSGSGSSDSLSSGSGSSGSGSSGSGISG